jgi:enoyl-CoA hydratase/carnithine racemase
MVKRLAAILAARKKAGNMPNFEHIQYRVENAVAHIVLNRPDNRNALGHGPGSSREEISQALDLADSDAHVGAVLIRANGPAFSGGGDLKGRQNRRRITATDHQQFIEDITRFTARVRTVHKPVIAAVHGYCLGTALSFISQCDFVIAAEDARFGLVEGRMGHPGASDLVPVIGAAWTKYLIFTGELIDVWRAERIGLVLTVVPRDALHRRAIDLAERMTRMPREGLRFNKLAIDGVMEASGRAAGRIAGRAIDTMTLGNAAAARAPDGRLFDEILKEEGMTGLKRARDVQYQEPWLESLAKN